MALCCNASLDRSVNTPNSVSMRMPDTRGHSRLGQKESAHSIPHKAISNSNKKPRIVVCHVCPEFSCLPSIFLLQVRGRVCHHSLTMCIYIYICTYVYTHCSSPTRIKAPPSQGPSFRGARLFLAGAVLKRLVSIPILSNLGVGASNIG